MRIYISGPMEGYPDHNEAAFYEAERWLRDQGYSVVNPINVMQVLPVWETTREEYMAVDLYLLDMCDAIYMLEGWERSEGAKAELARARDMRMNIIYQIKDRRPEAEA